MVRFSQVTKVFANGYIGLEDVSFAVEPGSLLYITGESGAGKTTLMRLLIREFEPTSGDIFLGEDNILHLPRKHIPYHRRRVGVVFQDYQLIPDRTIFENVALILEIMGTPGPQIQQRVSDVLEIVGLPDKGKLFPVQLSGGELQRAAIARALVTAPEVLFADEPTGNLDAETGSGVMSLLKKIQELGTTVLVATHDPAIMKNFTAPFIRLHEGKLVEETVTKSAKKTKKSQQDESEKSPSPDRDEEESEQEEDARD